MIRSPRPAARSLPAAPLWGPRRPRYGRTSFRWTCGHPWPLVTTLSCDRVRVGLAWCGEDHVVVALPLGDDVEEGVAHERHVHGPPTGVRIGRRWGGVGDVTEVDSDVAGLGVDSNDRIAA